MKPECTIHPHTSREKREKCWARRAGKRADRIIRMFNRNYGYKQRKHEPPLEIQQGSVKVFYFYDAVPIPI